LRNGNVARARSKKNRYDAVIIGSGPNGLSAAIVLAAKGQSVLLIEGRSTVGGGCRSAALTLPGFIHDVCSSIHPLGIGSPFFRTLPLERYGLEWVQPHAAYAHPLDGGKAAAVYRSIEETAAGLGVDGKNYARLMGGLNCNWDELSDILLHPQKLLLHPIPLALFGIKALLPADRLLMRYFRTEIARGLMAGVCAHATLPLDTVTSASFGLVLGLAAHTVGWPMPKGGAQRLSDALHNYLQSLGGEVLLDCPVESLDELPDSRTILCDITPRQLLRIGSSRLPGSYLRQLESYKFGPGVFKIDYALSGPVPWEAVECRKAGTVHLGGTLAEICQSEKMTCQGKYYEKPYVLVAQHTLFDPTRAPSGKHTLWAYAHVPNGSAEDMTGRIERQIERFAPGFTKMVEKKHVFNTAALEEYNPNYIGGEISGGAMIPSQLFTRPFPRMVPYATPLDGLYFCSSSTPPGAGVHGMCGYYAAHAAMRGWK
jgi:phytoene dehydrogenase-like protein